MDPAQSPSTIRIRREDAAREGIARAAARTGADFRYLLNQARSESGLNPNARAKESSAAGLFQFIDQSWLGVLKQHGAEHGMGWAADAIERVGGRWQVRDPALRQQVFALREDPEASALMAASSAQDNARMLRGQLGRDVGATDLYFAHFLGPAGAARFLKAAANDPGASAAAQFPTEAAVNRGIFYAGDGRARSMGEVYALMGRKIGDSGEPLAFGAGQPGAIAPRVPTLTAGPPLSPEQLFGGNFPSQPDAAFNASFAQLAPMGIESWLALLTLPADSGEPRRDSTTSSLAMLQALAPARTTLRDPNAVRAAYGDAIKPAGHTPGGHRE